MPPCVHRRARLSLPSGVEEKARATGSASAHDAMTSKGAIDVKLSGWTVVVVVLAASMAAVAPAQRQGTGEAQPREDVQADATPLGDVLRALEAQFGVTVATAPEVRLTIPITIHLQDVTVEHALVSIADRCGYVVIQRDADYLLRSRQPGEVGGQVYDGEPVPLTITECAEILHDSPGRDLNASRRWFAAIERLARIGSPEAVGLLTEVLRGQPGPTPDVSHTYRQQAICALGQIGSEEAVAAITAFEEWAAARYADPPPWRIAPPEMSRMEAAAYDAQALAVGTNARGEQWAIFRWRKFGQQDLWMARSLGDGLWDQPMLVEVGEGTVPWQNGQFALIFDDGRASFSTTATFSPEEFPRDADEDGLPDLVELRMHTRRDDPDSDDDSVPDGSDSNPLTPRQDIRGEVARIRQAVFAATWGTSDARDAIYVAGRDLIAQEYYGCLGPVLRSWEPVPGFLNVTELTVEVTGPDTATVDIAYWWGPLAAQGETAHLRKAHGRWVVTDIQMTWIS